MKTPFAASASHEPRTPRFLLGAANNDAAQHHVFAAATQADGLERRGAGHRAPELQQPLPPPPLAPPEAVVEHGGAALVAAELDSLRRESAARLAASVDRLQLTGARLAEEARADVVELAFQIARRILDGELRASHEALFGLVRAAVRRVGDARRVSIRLHPADAKAVQVAMDTGEPTLVSLTRVELHADPTLSLGDCLVDSDAGLVDGRLESRLQELRRAVDLAAEEITA